MHGILKRFASSSSGIHTEKIDKNLELRSPAPITSEPTNRPLVILYGWMMVKAKHLNKFGDLYLNKGCDVLNIRVQPNQVLRPKVAQRLAQRVLNYVEFERHRKQPVLVHGFSVGGYLYGELLVKVQQMPEKYASFRERLIGQVFDSPVDIQGIPDGFARVLSSNPVVQASIRNSLKAYLKLFYEQVTKHYEASSAAFHSNHLRSPTLMLYSKADQVGVPEAIEAVMENWTAAGIRLRWKRWEDSIHVGHMHLYQEEYIEVLMNFLEEIGLLALCRQEAISIKQ